MANVTIPDGCTSPKTQAETQYMTSVKGLDIYN